jgi:hypothetical protein
MTRTVAPVLIALAALALSAPAGAAAKGRVLATGDSMIQLVDQSLQKRLKPRRVRVKSDAHVGTGLSKPFLISWPRHARKIAASYRPKASVVFLGANEGFPMRHDGRRVKCCTTRWARAYAAQGGRMMRALGREGRGRVYWLTLPAARERKWNRIYRRVNQGLRIAVRRAETNVELVETAKVFTPTGRFQSSIRRGGRRVTVRQSDGIHLNARGASIAAAIVVRRMRRDGLFR